MKLPTDRIIFFVAVAISLVAIVVLMTLPSTETKPLAGKGHIIDDAAGLGGKFSLIDQDGEEYSSEKLKGKVSIIYFGFTYCPDICPTSLEKITKVVDTLEKYNMKVNPVFITIDPKRDTSNVLKEYLSHFHHNFIGLTGSEEQINKVANLYKVYHAKSQDENINTKDYMVDHTSLVYILDKNGKFVKHFYFSTTAEEITDFIMHNLR